MAYNWFWALFTIHYPRHRMLIWTCLRTASNVIVDYSNTRYMCIGKYILIVHLHIPEVILLFVRYGYCILYEYHIFIDFAVVAFSIIPTTSISSTASWMDSAGVVSVCIRIMYWVKLRDLSPHSKLSRELSYMFTILTHDMHYVHWSSLLPLRGGSSRINCSPGSRNWTLGTGVSLSVQEGVPTVWGPLSHS
jgi:hypothetical protein